MSGVYDFSQLFRSSIIAFSPGTTFIATAHLNRIIVRSTANLAVVRTWLCQPSSPAAAASSSKRTSSEDGFPIDSIQWSDDGMYILAFSAKTSSAWVFGLVEEGIGACGEMALLAGEGLDGLVHVEWAQGGREVLAWSDHNVRWAESGPLHRQSTHGWPAASDDLLAQGQQCTGHTEPEVPLRMLVSPTFWKSATR